MVSNYLEYILSEKLENCIDVSDIIKELKENYNYYNENDNYKSNIDFLINCLNENGLIYEWIISENEIIIKPMINNKWVHLYIRENFKDKFFTGIIFNEIRIIKDYYTIYINGVLFDMKNYLLSSFYEIY